MFEQAFNNIDNALWKDSGCDSELEIVKSIPEAFIGFKRGCIVSEQNKKLII
jgi:hypothetical protein